jgi:hypothetical protein
VGKKIRPWDFIASFTVPAGTSVPIAALGLFECSTSFLTFVSIAKKQLKVTFRLLRRKFKNVSKCKILNEPYFIFAFYSNNILIN